jgi:hypothetical protein
MPPFGKSGPEMGDAELETALQGIPDLDAQVDPNALPENADPYLATPGDDALLAGDIGDPLLDLMQETAEQDFNREALGGDPSTSGDVFAAPVPDVAGQYGEAGQGAGGPEAVDPEKRRQAVAALYGANCPLAKRGEEPPTPAEWAQWPKALWESLAPTVAGPIHRAQRNRLMRKGIQWISSGAGMGPWREPPKPKDAARMVANMIRPALDQRIQILVEQRPGFRTEPTTHDPAAIRKAEAQQMALEYQFNQQDTETWMAEAEYWAQTDGVSFACVYWDPDRGPWFEAGADRYRGGDLCTMIYRLENVRVSPNASATRKPFYWVIREELSQAEAVALYGEGVLEVSTDVRIGSDGGRSTGYDTGTAYRLGAAQTDADMLADQATVDRFTIYCEPTEYLADGLVMVAVGDVVVAEPKPLPFGKVPLLRWTDGSTDPAFYPEPLMDDWIAEQQMVNAALSKWVEGVRRQTDGTLVARSGAIATETLVGGMTSLIEVRGAGAVQDALTKLPPTAVGQDVKDLLDFGVKRFEMKSGWNDTSRGSFDAGDSGRAILAQREVLERVFSPPIKAAAKTMAKWGELTLLGMKWGYTQPRLLGIVGQSRSDLAVQVTAETFDGIADVHIDPETMQPLPRTLRLFLLDDMLMKGLISPQEYRRRMPFAFARSMESPDEDQFARAKRVAEAIRQSGQPWGPPGSGVLEIRWQDDESIHQDVLQRDLILPDDLDPMIRQAAVARWTMLAQQGAMKMAMLAPAPAPAGDGGEGGSSGPKKGAKQDPKTQPLAMNNPSVSSRPSGGSGFGMPK